MIRILALTLCLATPAWADFPQTVRNHILPGYAAFADATRVLAAEATNDCRAADLRPAYHAAFDAWLGVSHLRFGPVEQGGIGLAIAYWPDPKGSGARAQEQLLLGDPAGLAPDAFAEQSIAARGFFALERLLYPAAPLPADPCALIRATTLDLARVARVVNEAWTTSYAQTMLTAGEVGNATYLTRPEARQMLFTQIMVALEFDKDQRLGRPLGTFERPFPDRAEAVASGRPVRNLLLSLQSLREMVESLTPDVPQTMAAFDHAIALVRDLDDPDLAGVANPQARLRVEIVQQAVAAVRDAALAELGPELDVGIGFNAADGD